MHLSDMKTQEISPLGYTLNSLRLSYLELQYMWKAISKFRKLKCHKRNRHNCKRYGKPLQFVSQIILHSWNCNICGKLFPNLIKSKCHKKYRHDCKKCGKVLESFSKLKCHMYMCTFNAQRQPMRSILGSFSSDTNLMLKLESWWKTWDLSKMPKPFDLWLWMME